ncbi:MAG: hypothetical protein ACTTKF_03735 [Bacteroides sp.]
MIMSVLPHRLLLPLLFLLASLFPHTLFAQERDSVALSAVQRIKAKFYVTTAEEKPFTGTVTLLSEGQDRVYLYPNRFGLGFVTLLPETTYSVSVDGFPKLTHVHSCSLDEGEMEVELSLPPTSLRGQTAKENYGLVLFTYRDKEQRPLPNRLLYCTTDDGQLYSGSTDRFGKARVEVPLGLHYTFSVDGNPDFDEHTFDHFPPLQTVEITLTLGTPRPPKKRAPVKTDGESTQRALPAKPRFRNLKDSLVGATKRVKPTREQKKEPPQAFTIPIRSGRKSEPIVSKRILEGVYMLRNVVQRELRTDSLFIRRSWLSLLRTLNRKSYDNAVYVVDVTCSMDPFLEEYLLWLSLANRSGKMLGGVLFNDGDGRADSTKSVGSTGGIRATTTDLEEVADVLAASISYGCSGDDPENDLEALLYAQQRFPKAQQLILLADNGSNVRDLELLSQLRKPVHVILCSTTPLDEQNPPNPDYVTIAHTTGGSISSLLEDLRILQDARHPEQLSVGRWQYQKLKDRFVRPTTPTTAPAATDSPATKPQPQTTPSKEKKASHKNTPRKGNKKAKKAANRRNATHR